MRNCASSLLIHVDHVSPRAGVHNGGPARAPDIVHSTLSWAGGGGGALVKSQIRGIHSVATTRRGKA